MDALGLLLLLAVVGAAAVLLALPLAVFQTLLLLLYHALLECRKFFLQTENKCNISFY